MLRTAFSTHQLMWAGTLKTYGDDSIRLRLIPLEEDVPPTPAEWQYLDHTEQAKVASLSTEADKWRYVKSQAWLRTVLGHETHQSPQKVSILAAADGRNKVSSKAFGRNKVHFNLSRSRGCIAIATSNVNEVGVDIEEVRGATDLHERCLVTYTPKEWEEAMSLNAPAALTHFYQIMTAKKAYVKALGIGQGFKKSFSNFSIASVSDVQLHCDVISRGAQSGNQTYAYACALLKPVS
jgi:phosphopantetheinyl transferase